MDQDNAKTLQTYNENLQAYLDGTALTITDEYYKNWISHVLDGVPRNATIFEIGSGSGRDAQFIKDLGYTNIQPTDASKAFVEYMNGQDLDARMFNALTDEFPSAIDLLYANAVLLHFTKKETLHVLKAAHKALNIKGRIALRVKEGEGSEWSNIKMGAERYFHYWKQQDLIDSIESIGYTIEYTDIGKSTRPGEPKWVAIIARKDSYS